MTSLTDNESDVFAFEFNWTISTSSQLWNIKSDNARKNIDL